MGRLLVWRFMPSYRGIVAIGHIQIAADPVISIAFVLFQLFCNPYGYTKVLAPHWSFQDLMGRFLVCRFMPSHRQVMAIVCTQMAADPFISIAFAGFQLFCNSYGHTKVLGPHWSFQDPMGMVRNINKVSKGIVSGP